MKALALTLTLLAATACVASEETPMAQTELKEGAKAPDFTADSTAGPISLAGMKGKVVVLYFYPKDATPG